MRYVAMSGDVDESLTWGNAKMGRKQIEKRPVRLTNKFVAALTGEAMWWDDDARATGFGVRSYPGGGKSFFIDYRVMITEDVQARIPACAVEGWITVAF